MFSVFSAIAALIGRGRESLQTLTAAFIWTCVSSLRTLLEVCAREKLTFGFWEFKGLVGLRNDHDCFPDHVSSRDFDDSRISFTLRTSSKFTLISTIRISHWLSYSRFEQITSMYFFLVLLPLSWMAYEIRELAVLIFHDVCPGSDMKRKYDEEMDRGRFGPLCERGGRDGMASADEQEERIKMMEIGRKRRRSSRKGKERATSSNDESDRGRQRRRSSSRQRSADV